MKRIVLRYDFGCTGDDYFETPYEYEIGEVEIQEALEDYMVDHFESVLGDREMAKKVKDDICYDIDFDVLYGLYDRTCDIREICYDYFRDKALEEYRQEEMWKKEPRF